MGQSRRCKSKTKAGKPCSRAPVKGTDRCIAHSPRKEKLEKGFGGPQPGSGRPRIPTATELMRRVVEDNVEKILAPHFRVLGWELRIEDGEALLEEIPGGGAKMYGESKDGIVKASAFDDLAAMVAAAEKLLDRALGRPKQATELTGPNGGPIEADVVGIPTESEFHQGVAKILAAAGAAGDGD